MNDIYFLQLARFADNFWLAYDGFQFGANVASMGTVEDWKWAEPALILAVFFFFF